MGCFFLRKGFFLYIYLGAYFTASANAVPLDISQIANGKVCLERFSTYLLSHNASHLSKPINKYHFKTFEETIFDSDTQAIWMQFSISSESSSGDWLFVNCKFYDEVKLYEVQSNEELRLLRSTGYLPEYRDHRTGNFNANVDFFHPGNTKRTYLLGLISHTKNSRKLSPYFTSNCEKIFLEAGLNAEYKLPKFLLFFFFGGILMMSCYNAAVAIATQYKEYILFSIYNFCFVLMGMTLSNIHIELGWIQTFDFERNLRFLPALLGIPVYIFFCIHFLNIKELNNRIYSLLNNSIWLFPIAIAALLLSFFKLVFIGFAAVMPIVLVLILYSSWIRAKRYSYARYFLVGNMLVSLVGLVQLLSFYNYISVVNASVWSVVGLMLEILLFSFAVATKLKVMRKELFVMKTRNQIQQEWIASEIELKQKLELEIEKKSRALTSSSVQWLNLNDQLGELKKKIKHSLKEQDKSLYKEIIRQIEEIENFENQWNSFKIHFENVHKGFFEEIEYHFPVLSQNDLKICAFMKMKLSNKEIAQILNVTKKAVEQSKRRMRKKVGMETEHGLLEFIENAITANGKTEQGITLSIA